MALVVMEGIILSFWLLLICVVGIANGPVGLVCFYEKNVQERVIQLGLTTADKIKKATLRAALAMYIPELTLVPAAVYLINGAHGFWDGFIQLTAVYLIAVLFDRIFIDIVWVGGTKAWEIPGTEDLKPYIPVKVQVGKWLGCLIMFPLMAAAIAGGLSYFGF
ncbi:MAG: hypothetical protein IJM51_03510 [Clostridia bacterium]|nr:hypothetical protein [Clostridia bacterium]